MKNLLFRGILFFCCLISLNTVANAQVDLYLDSINVYVTSYGRVGIYSLPDTIRQLWKMSPLVGQGLGKVCDLEEDLDYVDTTQLIANPKLSDYEIYGSYNNNYSGLPPNVLIKENIYCWKNQNSILVKYTIINNETTALSEVFGLELIPEISGEYAGTDTVLYDPVTKIFSDHKKEAVGFKFLNGELNSLNSFIYLKGYNNDTSFWNWMTNGQITSPFVVDPADPNVDDPVIISSVGAKTIAVGDSAVYYVAVGFGTTKNIMLYNMGLAQQKYNLISDVRSAKNTVASGYNLARNYPNPFNPSTRIEYSVPTRGLVTLKVYNTLGNEVATLVNTEKPAGKYSVDFSSHNLPSGIYFYTIQSGSFSQTRKMLLLK